MAGDETRGVGEAAAARGGAEEERRGEEVGVARSFELQGLFSLGFEVKPSSQPEPDASARHVLTACVCG